MRQCPHCGRIQMFFRKLMNYLICDGCDKIFELEAEQSPPNL